MSEIPVTHVPDVTNLPTQKTLGTWSVPDAAVRWYVAHTQPHAENRATDNLERQAFTVFCPRMERTVRHARKVTKMRVPLFPGYLFIQLNPQRDRWRNINGTRGVVRLLTQGDTPIAVPTGVVEQIQSRIDSAGIIDWASSLICGQQVRVCDGPFTNLIGRIEHLDSVGRVGVLLDLMGRAVSVHMRPDMLSPLL